MGSIGELTTYDVLWGTPRVWSARSNCKNHHSHTWATTRALRSVGYSAQPPPRSERALQPICRILFRDSTMSWLIMAMPWGCRAAKTWSRSSSKNRR